MAGASHSAPTAASDGCGVCDHGVVRTRVLYVTDLSYEARGRRYCDEDIRLSEALRTYFDIALCHPVDAAALMGAFDAVVVRNSGPVLRYQKEYDSFRQQAVNEGVKVFNELTGKADMLGKQYLLDLFAAGYPVIPTVDARSDLSRLPAVDQYVLKPKKGADSVGFRVLRADELRGIELNDDLVQPLIQFAYEVSFYFINRMFQYALYAPNPEKRWALDTYEPGIADLAFAQRFVDWNDVEHGIQRVDACRTTAGDLLLVELEDLNPYMSLDSVDTQTRQRFIRQMAASIQQLAATEPV